MELKFSFFDNISCINLIHPMLGVGTHFHHKIPKHDPFLISFSKTLLRACGPGLGVGVDWEVAN